MGHRASLAASRDEQVAAMMTPERWQQVKGVMQEALEIAPEQRPAFLDRACSTDHSLRREVESLLSSSNDVRSSFMWSSPHADLRNWNAHHYWKRGEIPPRGAANDRWSRRG